MKRLKNIEIHPLAYESLGVRSMSTFVRTPDISLIVDPGVALGPRKPIIPHPKEYTARSESRNKILNAASKSDVLFVSHYHYDHYTPNYVDTVWLGSTPEIAGAIYHDKIVLAKDTRNSINFTQRRRGWIFQKSVEKHVKNLKTVDNETVEYGDTKLQFSLPVFHGEQESGLGWVLMLSIVTCDEKVIYAPDVQGPISDQTFKTIIDQEPDLLILGGPPSYLRGFKVSEQAISHGLANIARLVERLPTTVVDHHLLRSSDWRLSLEKAYEVAQSSGHELVTAAELVGLKSNPLECSRQKLYEENPPSREFMKWTKLPREERRMINPPV